MITSKRPITIKDSSTTVRIYDINPKSIIEECIKNDIKSLSLLRYRNSSNSSYDTGSRVIPNSYKPSLEHRRVFVPYIESNTILYNINGSLYLDLIDKNEVYCWWDRHKIETTPIPLPIKIEERGDKLIVYGEGYLCSLECCLAFIDEEESKIPCKRSIRYSNVRANIFTIFYHLNKYIIRSDSKLIASPSWKVLKYTGYGDMDIKDFRNNTNTFIDLPLLKLHPIQRCYQID